MMINTSYVNAQSININNQNNKTQSVKDNNENKSSSLSPKAAQIAEKIANGEYKLDMKNCAKALLDELV
ncbi:flagellar biosynthesis anti-sigma factor FlgM [Campylobacter canadensis]|uniref:Flagellar biosynthesis anti-sigma factor FlgM n=1 Tax=Campylobacter canadensis TaxID=449520 RepID=A0ABS7WQ82_9BACT|nr:flagellar biosynthesis anti-sigma factor FlgM [Campylobacter canadensis]MBZ7986927.1 flagellar biosynthesis anti-sigma factor FlgM [Campylobacter canadensis]MBZ7994248.1 flagellar biosynthesis anti-sigma factor FlgM [Campylobacter canadensis]MBZ7995760.1 flagellar biosynthesis anti-sigma factor FlgM [Campylobacter canadensis]MBZ7997963.1 flagellar biosynthesis anti-sigma factor FlgM [Campylobacter canadensis]MBZ7999580.1 flagellar biosynthesis anti-sigma factor FlgM [Campylobacter canadensi